MGGNLTTSSSEKIYGQPTGRTSHLFNANEYDVPAVREKKKKAFKFTTLRKKLLRTRRHCRNYDYAKQLRDIVSTWSTREIHSLSDDYDSMAALKELMVMANMARSSGSSIVEDLAMLYQNKYCSDVDLVYAGTVYPAHKAILCVRCAFFKDLLLHQVGPRPRVEVHVKTPGVDTILFSALLRYLYTGDFGLDKSSLGRLKPVLSQLAAEFGAPNSLEQDLKVLLETGAYSDAVLAFSTGVDSQYSCYSPSSHHRYFHHSQHCAVNSPMHCHKAILAARSPFFRNLIARRAKSETSIDDCNRALFTSPDQPSKQKKTVILLDESIIPSRFARVLLNAVYLDQVELLGVVVPHQPGATSDPSITSPNFQLKSQHSFFQHLSSPPPPSASCPGNVGPTTSSGIFPSPPTSLEEAMELYHIGRFLDFPSLAQGCEDIIAELMTVDNLLSVLSWSREAHGSLWVHRQALHFLTEEFIQFSQSQSFLALDKSYLIEAIGSDYLQASELDVLTSVIKWGEHRLIKRIEEQEPNILSHTAHSVSKKGIRKRDLNDTDLRDLLSDMLCHVRRDHLIPHNNESVVSAMKRGLIHPPPSWTSRDPSVSSACAWVKTRHSSFYVRPRLFTPYYEEVKAILREHHAKSHDMMSINNSSGGSTSDVVQLRVVHTCAVPDALYMLDEQMYSPKLHKQWSFSSSTVDILAGTIPIPEERILEEMKRRELELTHSKSAQKAYAICSSFDGSGMPGVDASAVIHQVRLRVVREFGLPDSTVEILRRPYPHFSNNPSSSPGMKKQQQQDLCLSSNMTSSCNFTPIRRNFCPQHSNCQLTSRHVAGVRSSNPHCSFGAPFFARSADGFYQGSSSAGILSSTCNRRFEMESTRNRDAPLVTMPDIAMATSSADYLQSNSSDIMALADLDLGDGSAHVTTGSSHVVTSGSMFV